MYYMHNIPGRLRIKIPKLQHRHQQCLRLEGLFARKKGVEKVTTNPLTGSVVFEYDDDCTSTSQILAILKKHHFLDETVFDESEAMGPDMYFDKASSHIGKACRKAVFGWAVGNALEGSGLSFLAAFI